MLACRSQENCSLRDSTQQLNETDAEANIRQSWGSLMKEGWIEDLGKDRNSTGRTTISTMLVLWGLSEPEPPIKEYT